MTMAKKQRRKFWSNGGFLCYGFSQGGFDTLPTNGHDAAGALNRILARERAATERAVRKRVAEDADAVRELCQEIRRKTGQP